MLSVYGSPKARAMGDVMIATDRLRRKLSRAGVSDRQSEMMHPDTWERLVERIAAKEFRQFQEAAIRMRELAMGRAS